MLSFHVRCALIGMYIPQSMAERLQTHPLFRTMSEEQQEDMMDGIEKHLMTSIYDT